MKAKEIVLIGGGHAHALALKALADRDRERFSVTLVSPSRWQHYSGMVPGWMTGQYDLEACQMDLRQIAAHAGARFVEDWAVGLDATRGCVFLSDGSHLPFDALSLDVGAEVDTTWLTALHDKLLPVKPMADFARLWKGLLARADLPPAFKLAIVGGGAAGVEVSLAAAVGLRKAQVTPTMVLITGRRGLLPDHPPGVRQQVGRALSRANVQVVAQQAVGTEGGVMLDDGLELPLDAAIAATGSRAPVWLPLTKLDLDEQGFVSVNACHQSTSHPNVFAAGDVCSRTDRAITRSGVHAVRAGPILAHNLVAWLEGRPMKEHEPRRWPLQLISTGPSHAVASWGPLSTSGNWVWRLKDQIDRRFMRSLLVSDRLPNRPTEGQTP